MPVNILFFGNSEGQFSTRFFQAFLATPCQLVGVVDVPPAKRFSTNKPVSAGTGGFVDAARDRGIPTFEPVSPNSPEFVQAARDLAPDLLVAVGYTNLLKADLLATARLLAVNFHASLLPAYRGKHPVFWALRNGERTAGLTVHVVSPALDEGDILYQVRVRTRREDTVNSLYDRIIERSLPLAPRLVADAATQSWRRIPQSPQGASYFGAVKDEDFRLDWSWPAEKLRRFILTTPGRCYADIGGRRIFFRDAKIQPQTGSHPPGTLLHFKQTCCIVASGSDPLKFCRVTKTPGEDVPAYTMRQVCDELGLIPGRSVW